MIPTLLGMSCALLLFTTHTRQTGILFSRVSKMVKFKHSQGDRHMYSQHEQSKHIFPTLEENSLHLTLNVDNTYHEGVLKLNARIAENVSYSIHVTAIDMVKQWIIQTLPFDSFNSESLGYLRYSFCLHKMMNITLLWKYISFILLWLEHSIQI